MSSSSKLLLSADSAWTNTRRKIIRASMKCMPKHVLSDTEHRTKSLDTTNYEIILAWKYKRKISIISSDCRLVDIAV